MRLLSKLASEVVVIPTRSSRSNLLKRAFSEINSVVSGSRSRACFSLPWAISVFIWLIGKVVLLVMIGYCPPNSLGNRMLANVKIAMCYLVNGFFAVVFMYRVETLLYGLGLGVIYYRCNVLKNVIRRSV